MTSVVRSTALALTLGLCSRSAAAQSLAGRVVEEHSRLPLRSVQVAVLADSARLVSSSTTDSIGAFYADLPSGGIYRVRISVDSETTFESAPITVRDSAYVEREFAIPLEERIYVESEVTRTPVLLPMAAPPKYPAELVTAQVEGSVLAEYVVDTTGSIRPGSFVVLQATDPRFASSVRKAYERARFVPADRNGVRVAMRVRQRFNFGIDQMRFEHPDATRAPTFPKPSVP